MDRDEVEVHKLAKKRTRPISSHLDRTNLVNKGFIIWLLGKFCLRDTAGSPERARSLHLARSGSQSQLAIWFILPARGASHIIILNIDDDQFPQQPSIANRKKARVNISNFAFCKGVLLPSRIPSAVAVTTIMPLDLFFLKL